MSSLLLSSLAQHYFSRVRPIQLRDLSLGDRALLTGSRDGSNVGFSVSAFSDPSAVGDHPLHTDGRPLSGDACGSSNGSRDPHFGCGAAIKEIHDDVPVSEGDDSDCIEACVL